MFNPSPGLLQVYKLKEKLGYFFIRSMFHFPGIQEKMLEFEKIPAVLNQAIEST